MKEAPQSEIREATWSGKPTLVLGASLKRRRASNRAVRMLTSAGHTVYALGLQAGNVAGIEIETEKSALDMAPLHTVTLYLNPRRQPAEYDYILGLSPQRIIFNPGTENPELWRMARARGIECVNACTLVMVNWGQF